MRQLTQPWFIAVFFIGAFCGCQRRVNSGLAATCSGLSGKAYNDCITAGDYAQDKMVKDLKNMGGMSLVQMVGPVHKITGAGGCLSFTGADFIFEPCQNLATRQEFHFVAQINTTYQLMPGVALEGIAFRIATRASVNQWSLDASAEAQMQCLTVASDGWPAVAPCDSASYMMMIPNQYGADWDKARQEKNQYGSFVGMVKDTPQLDNAFRQQEKADKQAADTLDIGALLVPSKGSTDEAPEPVKRVVIDLGNIAAQPACGAYPLLASPGHPGVAGRPRPLSPATQQALGASGELAQFQCTTSNVRDQQESNTAPHLWAYSCGLTKFNEDAACQDLLPIKYYPDFQKERNQGGVVQILPKQKNNFCLMVQGSQIITIDDCERNAHDNATTQFRLELVENKPNGEVSVRLRSMLDTSRCADLAASQLIPCKQGGTYDFNPQTNDLRVAGQGNPTFFFFQSCMDAASHAQSSRYDCRREIPWKYQLYNQLSTWIGMIPVLGTIPSYVFGGLLCASDEVELKVANCIGLGLQLGMDILTCDVHMMGSFARFAGGESMKIAGSTKMLAKALLSRAAGSPAQVQMRKNTALVQLIEHLKPSPDEFRALMQKIRVGNDCAGASCAGPLIDIPNDADLKTMLDKKDKLNMTPEQLGAFEKAVGPLFR